MSDYIIATSSTSDLPRTWLEEHNIPFIAYSYTVNDEPREDDCREETRAAVYAGMRRGDKLHTSMINEFVYYDLRVCDDYLAGNDYDCGILGDGHYVW